MIFSDSLRAVKLNIMALSWICVSKIPPHNIETTHETTMMNINFVRNTFEAFNLARSLGEKEEWVNENLKYFKDFRLRPPAVFLHAEAIESMRSESNSQQEDEKKGNKMTKQTFRSCDHE